MIRYYKNIENFSNSIYGQNAKKPGKNIDITINCNGGGDRDETAAFRATKTNTFSIEANTPYKIFFQNEQFDIGNIYNVNTSTLVPREEGVYYVSGLISFFPDDTEIDYRVRVEIRVNGETVAADNDFFGPLAGGLLRLNVIQTSTILNLQAGDLVEIFVTSSTSGQVEADVPINGLSTRFEAAKF